MIILFDLDGTLIDSTEAILESFHFSFDTHNSQHPSDTKIKSLIGYPLDIMYANLGIEKNLVWNHIDTYKKYYRKISKQKTYLLEGAKEAVEKASKIATLGIVTTKTSVYSEELMENFKLMKYFDTLIGREQVENPKPHKEPILKALKELEKKLNLYIDKNEVWMIGDTKLDLISAKDAGVGSIGVLSGYDSKQTLEIYTDKIFKNAKNAIDFLEETTKLHTK